MIFESHAHYDDIAFDKDRDKILKSMKEHGVGMIMNISSDFPSIEKTLLLTEKFPFIYGAIGVHPCDCKCLTEEKIQWIKEKCKSLWVSLVLFIFVNKNINISRNGGLSDSWNWREKKDFLLLSIAETGRKIHYVF